MGGKKSQQSVMCTKPNVKAIERNRGNLKDVGRYGRRVSSRMMATPWRMKKAVGSHVAGDCVIQQIMASCIKPDTTKVVSNAMALAAKGGRFLSSPSLPTN